MYASNLYFHSVHCTDHENWNLNIHKIQTTKEVQETSRDGHQDMNWLYSYLFQAIFPSWRFANKESQTFFRFTNSQVIYFHLSYMKFYPRFPIKLWNFLESHIKDHSPTFFKRFKAIHVTLAKDEKNNWSKVLENLFSSKTSSLKIRKITCLPKVGKTSLYK